MNYILLADYVEFGQMSFNLKDIRKFWGFGVRYDWINTNGKTLSDISEK